MDAVYIHIPFCKTICSYCDFCKMHYNSKFVDSYLDALDKEITTNYQQETIKTIYIGGGTPSCLSILELTRLMMTIKHFKLNQNYEFTFECNIEDLDEEKLVFLYKNGVNRLSIGVQTFNPKLLKYLNRHHDKNDVISKINLAKKIGFTNISIDLIYAICGQTLKEVKEDLDEFLKLDINHISTYSLIIEPNTKLYIDKTDNIDEDLDADMYELINKQLKLNGFLHYETSNFAKPGFESKHNLVYWNNQPYYGFGLGASGYINNIRYENTRNLSKYLNNDYIKEKNELSLKDQMQYEMILGLRKTSGVNKQAFFDKYQTTIDQVFDIKELLDNHLLLESDEYLYINEQYSYIANNILVKFI